MKKLKVGIIGCGNIAGIQGQNRGKFLTHASIYNNLKNIDLVAIADTNNKKLLKFFKFWKPQKIYSDYRKMIKENKLDLISICTPSNTHYKIINYCIDYNIKKIFCEKPVCENLIQIKKINKKLKKTIVSINYFRRWNQDIIYLKKLIFKGTFGKVNKVNFNYTKSLLNNGLHLLDICIFLFGVPNKIEKIKKYEEKFSDNKLGYDFSLYFKNKDLFITFNHIPNTNYMFLDCEIYFTQHYVHLKERLQTIEIFNIVKDKNYKSYCTLKKNKSYSTGWLNSIKNALTELIIAKNNKQISHNLKDSNELFKLYEKITK